MVFRRSLVLVLVLVFFVAGVAACGDADRPTQLAAGGAPVASTTTTTTTAPVGSGAASAASPVDGLEAGQLKAILEAPLAGSTRSASGPTVDQVTLPDGMHVWRVRVPGTFAARSARIAVTVGGRRVGEAVLAPDLQAITAVTTDGSGLTAGRSVSYQWEGGPSVPAGTLAVVR